MKRIMLSGIVILLISGIVNAQTPKEKKKVIDENTEFIYTVTDKNEKNGAVYIIDTKQNKTYLKGTNTNNQPAGKWYFYNEDGTLESHYNFDLKKLLYIDSAYLKKIEVGIIDKNQEVVQNASIPILLYPSHLLLKQISHDVQIPSEDFNGQSSLAVKLKASIQVNGDVEYFVEYMTGKKLVERKVVLTTKELAHIWIPAQYKGKSIKSSFAINTSLSNDESKVGHRKFTWNY